MPVIADLLILYFFLAETVMTTLQCRAEREGRGRGAAGGNAAGSAKPSLSPSLLAQHFRTYSISAMWEELPPCRWRATDFAQISRYSRLHHVSPAHMDIQIQTRGRLRQDRTAAGWLAVNRAAPAKHL